MSKILDFGLWGDFLRHFKKSGVKEAHITYSRHSTRTGLIEVICETRHRADESWLNSLSQVHGWNVEVIDLYLVLEDGTAISIHVSGDINGNAVALLVPVPMPENFEPVTVRLNGLPLNVDGIARLLQEEGHHER